MIHFNWIYHPHIHWSFRINEIWVYQYLIRYHCDELITVLLCNFNYRVIFKRGLHGRDCMVVSRIREITPIIQHIMWTSTREDTKGTYCVPNHFVPVITIGNKQRGGGGGGVVLLENEPDLFHGAHSNVDNISLDTLEIKLH